MKTRAPVLGAIALAALAGAAGLWIASARRPVPDEGPARPPGGRPAREPVEVRVEPAPPSEPVDRDRLLTDARSESPAVRRDTAPRLGRALDQGNDAKVLGALQSLAARDPDPEVRAAALGELVFRNDRSSFDLLLDSALMATAPAPVRLRAIQLLERVGRKDYALFLANHGCPAGQTDRVAVQRREKARLSLENAVLSTPDAELRGALEKTLARFR